MPNDPNADPDGPDSGVEVRTLHRWLTPDLWYPVLLCAMLLMMPMRPLVHDLPLGRVLVKALLIFTFVGTVVTIGRTPGRLKFLGILAGASVTTLALEDSGRAYLGLAVIFFTASAVCMLRDVLNHGQVALPTICGALCVYLFIAAIFGFTYQLLELANPGSFSGLDKKDLSAQLSELMYFSNVTQTTVGYGDITPVSPAARSLSNVHALLGQLYLVVLVARFVGALGSSAPKEQGADS